MKKLVVNKHDKKVLELLQSHSIKERLYYIEKYLDSKEELQRTIKLDLIDK